MLSKTYSRKPYLSKVVISARYRRVGSVSVSENDTLVRKSSVEVVDFSKLNQQFSYKDFSFENLASVGATNILIPRQFADNSVDAFVSSVNTLVNEISSQKASQQGSQS